MSRSPRREPPLHDLGLSHGLGVREERTGGRLGKFLAANRYAAYVWHPLLIVPLQMAFLGAQSPPLAKFALVTISGVPVVYLWSGLSRVPRLVRAAL